MGLVAAAAETAEHQIDPKTSQIVSLAAAAEQSCSEKMKRTLQTNTERNEERVVEGAGECCASMQSRRRGHRLRLVVSVSRRIT